MLRSQELFFIVPIPGDTVPVPDDNKSTMQEIERNLAELEGLSA